MSVPMAVQRDKSFGTNNKFMNKEWKEVAKMKNLQYKCHEIWFNSMCSNATTLLSSFNYREAKSPKPNTAHT